MWSQTDKKLQYLCNTLVEKVKVEELAAQSYLSLCNPVTIIHQTPPSMGLQARIRE